ncbi:MAG: hypothetical protein ABSE54_03220 [Smithella sp.]|jgi:hypothetical protein
MAKKLKIKFDNKPSIIIHRTAVHNDKLVYIARANKKIKYPSHEKSRIVYIGTTKKGAKRIASSAALRGEQLLYEYGIKHLEFNIVTCTGRTGVETWKKLERALIIRFRERFGIPPKANKSGKFWRKDKKILYSEKRLDQVIDALS